MLRQRAPSVVASEGTLLPTANGVVAVTVTPRRWRALASQGAGTGHPHWSIADASGRGGRNTCSMRTRVASPLRAVDDFETPSPDVRVLIADGESLVRAAFRALLESNQRIRVVCEAATGEEAVALTHRTRPDVVVMDEMLPGLDSVEATGRMLSGTGAAVMLLTACEGKRADGGEGRDVDE